VTYFFGPPRMYLPAFMRIRFGIPL